MKKICSLLALGLAIAGQPVPAQVVINEIFYHAPNDAAGLQWIELHNTTSLPVNLAGWSLAKGVKFSFTNQVTLAPHGFAVVCRDREIFEQYYEVPVAGEFGKALKRSGERLDLRNASGAVVDSVTFSDHAPWPAAPDGWTASLERICPSAPGDQPGNWAASPLAEDATQPGGTPGAANAARSEHLPPIVSHATVQPACAAPGQTITVEADVEDPLGLREVTLLYRVAGSGMEGQEKAVAMARRAGRHYVAEIPGQPAGQVVRCRIQAVNQQSARRFWPGENEPRPAMSCLVFTNVVPGKVPFAYVINTDPKQYQEMQRQRPGPGGDFGWPGGPGGPGNEMDGPPGGFEERGPRRGGPGGGPGPRRGGPEGGPGPRREGPGGGFGGPGGPFGEGGPQRFMAEMQFRTALDLAPLWCSLTLSNAGAGGLEKLRMEFARQAVKRSELQEKTLQTTNWRETESRLSGIVKTFKAGLREAIQPLLDPEQAKALEAWVKPAEAGGGPGGFGRGPFGFGGGPAMLLRLEPAYLFLSTQPNLTSAQFAAVRDIYREALAQREALPKDIPGGLGMPMMMGGGDPRLEQMQAKVEAVGAGVDKKLKQVLTPRQARDLAGWRRREQPGFGFMGPGGPAAAGRPVRGTTALVYVDPQDREPKLFDFIQVTARSGGYKLRLGKDQPLKGMPTLNVIAKPNERWALSEPLAYEFHRRTGQEACRTDFFRMWFDGQPAGCYFVYDQPGAAFFRRAGIEIGGSLYKSFWRGQGLKGQHLLKSDPTHGHEDLIQLVEELQKAKGDPAGMWALIQREFDARQVANHYAARLVLSDWDGFFNNFYLYHDTRGTGKWMFFPWDQDQTWGDAGFGNLRNLLIDLPLTFGAEGDQPPGRRDGGFDGGMGMGGGGGMWWRPGGYLSKPLLANPVFRQLVLARIAELLATEFTEARLFPLVDQLRERLLEEVRFRAGITREDPARAVARFDANLASFKTFVTKRREWLLAQEEIRQAAKAGGASK